jgi:hypothetical protein
MRSFIICARQTLLGWWNIGGWCEKDREEARERNSCKVLIRKPEGKWLRQSQICRDSLQKSLSPVSGPCNMLDRLWIYSTVKGLYTPSRSVEGTYNLICSCQFKWFKSTYSPSHFVLTDYIPGQVPVTHVRFTSAHVQVRLPCPFPDSSITLECRNYNLDSCFIGFFPV